MNPLPPLPPSRDAEHLRLLQVFHYIFGALSIPGLGFLHLHYSFMSLAFSHPWPHKPGEPGPPVDPMEFFRIFRWVYLAAGTMFLVSMILNVASAWAIGVRRHRFFSLIVAGIDCVFVPLGIILGIFTIIVLSRPIMPALYRSAEAGRSA